MTFEEGLGEKMHRTVHLRVREVSRGGLGSGYLIIDDRDNGSAMGKDNSEGYGKSAFRFSDVMPKEVSRNAWTEPCKDNM